MKKTFCILLTLCLLLSAASAEDTPISGPWSSGTTEELKPGDPIPELPGQAEITDERLQCTDLASAGGLLWRLRGRNIRCVDPASETTAAGASFEEVLSSALTPVQLESAADYHLLSWTENTVLLSMTTEGEGGLSVWLFELSRQGETVTLVNTFDATAALAPYFGDGWLETDLVYSPQGLYIAALDTGYNFRLLLYTPASGELRELGEQPLLLYYASVPYENNILIAGVSTEREYALDLTVLQLPSGALDPLDTVDLGSGATPVNYAWNAEQGALLFTLGAAAYRYTPGSGEAPEAFALLEEEPVMNRLGAVAGGRYFLLDPQGKLLTLDPRAELNAELLQVANLTGEETVPAAAAAFRAAHPELLVQVRDSSGDRLLEDILNQDAGTDVYILSSETSAWQALRQRGFPVPLSGSAELAAAVADMPEAVQAQVTAGGELIGLPLASESSCRALNLPVWQSLTGLKEEDIPTDWIGFLNLLRDLAEKGTLRDHPDFTLYEGGFSADQFRRVMFGWILEDTWLWLSREENRLEQLQTVLPPVLHALEEVDWEGLGFDSAAQGQDLSWFITHERQALITEVQPETAAYLVSGLREWPLSLQPGGERLIPQILSVLWINPWSARKDAALAFAQTAWQQADPLQKTALCRSLNEPIPNDSYEEDLRYLEGLVPLYEQAVSSAETQGEAETLQQELEELRAELEDYRENGRWLASEKTIAAYRALENQLTPAVPAFWSEGAEDQEVLRYLDGRIPAEKFAELLASALRMSRLEDS